MQSAQCATSPVLAQWNGGCRCAAVDAFALVYGAAHMEGGLAIGAVVEQLQDRSVSLNV
ncbi:hypothetical protein D3C72_2530800 [compost metagenome]